MASLLAFVSSLLWGTADFMGGVLSRRLRPIVVVFTMQIFGLAAITVFVLGTGSWQPGTFLWWGVAAGVTGVAGLVTFYSALSAGTMGIIAPITSLGVLVPLIVGLVLGEQPSTVQWLGIVGAIAGVVLASGPELNGGAPVRPLLLALATALLFGLSVTCMAQGSGESAAMTIFAMRVVQNVIGVGAFILWRGIPGVRLADLPAIAAVGVTDVTANLVYGFAAGIGPLVLVAVLGSIYPLVTVVLGAVLLRERLTLVQYVGVLLALAGAAAVSAG